MANIRFAVGIKRPMPFFGFHHVLMILIVAASSMSALLLAGCTSSAGGIDNIYLLSLNYSNHSDSSSQSASLFRNASVGGRVTVRAGYLGLCARSEDQSPWICASDPSGLGLNFASNGASGDPLDAIGWAARFKSDVVFPGLVFGAMALSALAFLGFANFPGWHEERDPHTGEDLDIKPFPNRNVLSTCLFLMFAALLFLLTSAVWQHVAAASAARIIASGTQGYLSGHVGPAAAVLVWLALFLTALVAIGTLVTVMSVRLLDRLTDE